MSQDETASSLNGSPLYRLPCTQGTGEGEGPTGQMRCSPNSPSPQPSPLGTGEREQDPQPALARREFLSGAGRLCAAVSLAGACGYLVLRNPRGDALDCVKLIPCDDCGKFVRCELPKAELSRTNKANGPDGAAHA